MKCEELEVRLTEVVVDGIEEQPDLEAHLTVCVACRHRAAELRRLWERLGGLQEPVPTANLQARFRGLLDSYQDTSVTEGGTTAPSTPPAVRSTTLLRWVALAAACLLLGIGVGRWTAPSDSGADQLADLERQVGSLTEMVTLSLLQQSSAAARLQGVHFGRGHGVRDPEVSSALVERIANDPSVNVRLAAIEALEPVATRPDVRATLADSLSRQSSPLVQIALVDFLLSSGEPSEREVVERLLEQPTLHSEVLRHVRLRLGQEI